jgi:preprotein translocase subunit SecD
MVDESTEGLAAERGSGAVPFGSERYLERDGPAVIVKKTSAADGRKPDRCPGRL